MGVSTKGERTERSGFSGHWPRRPGPELPHVRAFTAEAAESVSVTEESPAAGSLLPGSVFANVARYQLMRIMI